MNERKKKLNQLIKQNSVLAGIVRPADLAQVFNSKELRASIAVSLKSLGTEATKTRATFIYEQEAKNFSANREKWGIPNFAENLVDSDDFGNGFLWRFRAHTT